MYIAQEARIIGLLEIHCRRAHCKRNRTSSLVFFPRVTTSNYNDESVGNRMRCCHCAGRMGSSKGPAVEGNETDHYPKHASIGFPSRSNTTEPPTYDYHLHRVRNWAGQRRASERKKTWRDWEKTWRRIATRPDSVSLAEPPEDATTSYHRRSASFRMTMPVGWGRREPVYASTKLCGSWSSRRDRSRRSMAPSRPT